MNIHCLLTGHHWRTVQTKPIKQAHKITHYHYHQQCQRCHKLRTLILGTAT